MINFIDCWFLCSVNEPRPYERMFVEDHDSPLFKPPSDARRMQPGESYLDDPYMHKQAIESPLAQCEQLFLAGDKNQILKAMYVCSAFGVAQPLWLREAFCRACDDVRDFKHKSWDGVFGRPHPKRKRRSNINPAKAFLSYLFVKSQERQPKDPFEFVAKELGMSRPTVIRYYYDTSDQVAEFIRSSVTTMSQLEAAGLSLNPRPGQEVREVDPGPGHIIFKANVEDILCAELLLPKPEVAELRRKWATWPAKFQRDRKKRSQKKKVF